MAVNVLAVNVLAVNRPVPLYIVSKSAFCTLNSVKKRVAHPIYSVFYALSVLFEVLKFLEQNKSTYTNPFSKLQREVDYAREDANDNVKFLQAPHPGDHVLTVLKAGESVIQTLLLTKTVVHVIQYIEEHHHCFMHYFGVKTLSETLFPLPSSQRGLRG